MSSLPAAVASARAISESEAAPAREEAHGESEREYRRLMRKWWFGAAVGAPTMILSYPWVFPALRDLWPRGPAARSSPVPGRSSGARSATCTR